MVRKALLVVILSVVLAVAAQARPVFAQGCNQELEAVGVLSAGYVYMTYGFIGAAGDAYSKGSYTSEQVQSMMKETSALLDTVGQKLGGLSNLTAEDETSVASIVRICLLLKSEAEGLSAYVASNSQADLDQFNRSRDKAWQLIKQLLGLE
ncbi:MAG: hypothetical protein AB1896_01895 [Thermodesulfobacteriota bacterium]